VPDLLLADALLADGRRVDVSVSGGRIDRMGPVGTGEGDRREDLDGRLLLPAFGEPHAHLDKAYLADVVSNPAGDLPGAIAAMRAAWPRFTVDDVAARAARAVRALVAAGCTAVRSHLDVNSEAGLRSVEALAGVRSELGALCRIELVALTHPLTGPGSAANRRLLEAALDRGVGVVGGAPHLEEDPVAAVRFVLDLAAERGLAVDLHVDEVLDPAADHLPLLAREVAARGLGGRATASHCVSHGLLPSERQREVGRMLAGAGVAVVTLPRTNLFLQARGIDEAPPRGLPGVRALLDAGVAVAAGGDNLEDPFAVVGRADPLEAAALLVVVGHLGVDEAAAAVSAGVRRVMGLAPVDVTAGSPAELVALRAGSVREAVAGLSPDRIVVHDGRVVARTTVAGWTAS